MAFREQVIRQLQHAARAALDRRLTAQWCAPPTPEEPDPTFQHLHVPSPIRFRC